MKAILVGLGSAGDVHPMIAIAQALQARGHAVELLANPVHADLAARCGVPMHPVGTADQALMTAQHPLLWHPIKGLGVLWRYLLRPAIVPVFDRIESHARAGACTVVAAPVAFGARFARDILPVSLITVYTAATLLRSCQDPMSIANWRMPRWMPQVGRRAIWAALDRLRLEPLVQPDFVAARRTWSVPPVDQSIFGEWVHSPDGGCTLFPSWFAHAGDWPTRVRQAGFMLFDGDGGDPPPAGLQAFLSRGSKPVVITAGSARDGAPDFFRRAAAACRQRGLRAVLVGRGSTAAANIQHGDVYAADYVPFGWLLPRTAAVVHHGGVGTCAQALRAGMPQLVIPSAYDQFDNGMRLQALGAGTLVNGASARADWSEQLARLLDDRQVERVCGSLVQRIDVQAARQTVCEEIELWR